MDYGALLGWHNVRTVTAKVEEKRALTPTAFYRSAVGKKWVMAVTGLIIIGFLIFHMAGNWKIFLPDVAGIPDIDVYAEALRALGVPFLPEGVFLWVLRTGLIIAFLLHIHAAYSLTLVNRRARPERYQGPRVYVSADYASRTMRWSGAIVIFFVLFHLADLTWGVEPAAPEVWERGEVYANFVATFSRPLVSIFYIVSMGLIAVHLYHGAWSMFQSVGINHPRFNSWRRGFATFLALLTFAGNSIMPLAVMLGWVS